MSVHMTSLIWRCSEHKGNELLVLLAIADNADHDTAEAYPSWEHLSRKTRLSRRAIADILCRLLDGDELTRVRRGSGRHAAVYRLEVQNLHSKPDRLVVQTAPVRGADGARSGAAGRTPTVREPSEGPSVKTLGLTEPSFAGNGQGLNIPELRGMA